jgi:hypothetical protein
MKRMSRTLFALTAALVLGLFVTGCYVETTDPHYHEPGVYLGDLEVSWRVEGSQAVSLCDAYGIDSWDVEVRGPESRDVSVDCRQNWWSSESDLLAMYEGRYTVTVRARDLLGRALAGQSTTVDVVDDGFVKSLTFQFYPFDFGY